MLQALVKKGKVIPAVVPAPVVSNGGVLIKVVNSCLSAGTEISTIQESGKPLIKRAIEQPDNVKKVLNMARSEGIAKTIVKVRGKLETGSPIGYSLSGIAIAVGEGVKDIRSGDRVAAAGAGLANHAEFVDVPRNLVMRMPEGLGFKEASTVALGGIAMQGVRRAQVQLGEFVVIFGTGILGLLSLQTVMGSGARVIAVDIDRKRLDMAKSMGAELCFNSLEEKHYIKSVLHSTNGHGADVVLFCAATNNSQALSDAFTMTRKKGRVVMVGVWGRELKREDIYAKELDFLISTSYGPGRYDEDYEQHGLDYPYPYVRWTENRNMEEYLRLLATGKIQVKPLIQATYPLEEVEQAFEFLQSPDRNLMVLLDYGQEFPADFSSLARDSRKVENKVSFKPVAGKRIRVGMIGAGNFAVNMHLPNLKKLEDSYEIRAICSRTGSKAQAVAQQFGAKYSTTDYHEVLSDRDIDLVMICTRHNLHGQMVMESLRTGKHTFVEKPLCTTQQELDAIKSFYDVNNVPNQRINQSTPKPILMVGFNRRFSEYAQEVKRHIQNRINPLFLHYRMNAGYIPLDNWVHTEEGGGRIIGEACHIIDLFSFLIGSQVHAISDASLRPKTSSLSSSDNKTIVLEYEDGSVATLEYFALGYKELPKEYLEVHFDEKTIIVDDYKTIQSFGLKVANLKSHVSDKGHLEELETLAECLTGKNGEWPIAWESIVETTDLTLKIA